MNSVLRTISHSSHSNLSVHCWLQRLMLALGIHQDMVFSVSLHLPVLLHDRHPLGNLSLESLLECRHARIDKAVRVPDVVRMVDIQVLGHGILFVLPRNCTLVLSEAVDNIVPGLPVIFGQDVGDGALLDQVLDT